MINYISDEKLSSLIDKLTKSSIVTVAGNDDYKKTTQDIHRLRVAGVPVRRVSVYFIGDTPQVIRGDHP